MVLYPSFRATIWSWRIQGIHHSTLPWSPVGNLMGDGLLVLVVHLCEDKSALPPK
jgi:hypothetical protein